MFLDPDTDIRFTVHSENLEFRRGRDGGWCLIGNSPNGSEEDEGFFIGEMVIGLIADTQQAVGVEVVRREAGN